MKELSMHERLCEKLAYEYHAKPPRNRNPNKLRHNAYWKVGCQYSREYEWDGMKGDAYVLADGSMLFVSNDDKRVIPLPSDG